MKYYLDAARDYHGGVDQMWGRSIYSLRQIRFRGKPPHPHDVMAADSNLERLLHTVRDWHKDIENLDEFRGKPAEEQA